MCFLINKFLAALELYGYKFITTIQSNNVIILHLYNLPAELDVELLKLSYTCIEYFDDHNCIKNSINCCMPSKSNEEEHIVVVLDKNTYANKINMIDAKIKEYRRNQYKKRSALA